MFIQQPIFICLFLLKQITIDRAVANGVANQMYGSDSSTSLSFLDPNSIENSKEHMDSIRWQTTPLVLQKKFTFALNRTVEESILLKQL